MGMTLDVVDARVVTPTGVLEPGWVRLTPTGIEATGRGAPPPGPGPRLDADGGWALPGFIDLHVHGAVGSDAGDADVDGLLAIAGLLARHGVTRWLPTVASAPPDATRAAVTAIARAAAAQGDAGAGGARIAGANLEGPFLSPAQCGAQDPDALRPICLDELAALLASGIVRCMTLAPELVGAEQAIARLRAAGAIAAIGHTAASFADTRAAIAAGAGLATHLCNAMPPWHHRAPGPVGAVLADPALPAELIVDGVHLHPGTVAALFEAFGADRVCLVSDALAPTGCPPDAPSTQGSTRFGPHHIIRGDGALWREDGGLAGSTLTLDRALHHLRAATGAALTACWPATSRTPARVLGTPQPAHLAPGGLADLVVLAADGTVRATVIAGVQVHPAP